MASLELGETHLGAYVGRWRKQLAGRPDHGYAALLAAMSARRARRVGVAVDDWLDTDQASTDRAGAERAADLVAQIDDDGLGALWDEPHCLGWFHQHFGQPERAASNRAHERAEQKHGSQTVTTQLYTPRWIAQFLARACLQTYRQNPSGADSPSVCDPAVGGGQMLVCALDAMVAAGADAADAARRLRGVDLDARAVEVARRTLALDVAGRLGRRDRDVEAHLAANVRVADGLFDDVDASDIVLTNPPYMGSRSMPTALKQRIRGEFRPFHADLYTAFIRRCHQLSTNTIGVLAQQTVWFLSRFAKARRWLLDEAELVEFMHLGAHAFANLAGEKANVVAFVQTKSAPAKSSPAKSSPAKSSPAKSTRFVDLRDFGAPAAKYRAFVDRRAQLSRVEPTDAFDALPGRVLAHWLPDRLRDHFGDGRTLADIADIPGSQNKTGKNRRYVRTWTQVDTTDIRDVAAITGRAAEDAAEPDQTRWVFYSKGGRYAPWWGNWANVVDWSDQARQFYADNRTSNLLAPKWWFKEGICYTDFGGRTFNARWMPPGCVFDMAGPAIFPHGGRDQLFALLGVLNSSPVRALLNALNPSLHYQVRDLRHLPVPEWSDDLEAELAERARQLVDGLRRVAGHIEASPCRPESGQDTAPIAAFIARLPALQTQLDTLVCQLYGCPELAGATLPTHIYVKNFGK